MTKVLSFEELHKAIVERFPDDQVCSGNYPLLGIYCDGHWKGINADIKIYPNAIVIERLSVDE